MIGFCLKRIAVIILVAVVFIYVISLGFPSVAEAVDFKICLPLRTGISEFFSAVSPPVFELALLFLPLLILHWVRRAALSRLLFLLSLIFFLYTVTLGIPSAKAATEFQVPQNEGYFAAAEELCDSISRYSGSLSNDRTELVNEARLSAENLYYGNTGARISLANAKISMFPKLLSKLGIHAYYSPITSEAVLNSDLPDAMLAYNFAHELAHRLGIVREDEANLFSFVALNYYSSNPYLNYSASLMAYIYIAPTLHSLDPSRYALIYGALPERAKTDIAAYNAFLFRNVGKLSDVSSYINDSLILLRDNRGAKSYSATAARITAFLTQSSDNE